MVLVSIDGVDLPTPSTYRPPQFDLDSGDTGRNELGVMQRDRIRQGIYRLELEWKAINSSKLATIKAATQPDKFEVTFYTEAGYVTKTMYAGDRNIEMARGFIESDIRWNVSCNLIEY